MAFRDVLDFDFLRRGKAIPAAVALTIAAVAWFGVQSVFLGDDSDAAPTPPPVKPVPASPPPQAVPDVVVQAAPVFPNLLVARRDLNSGVMLISELVEWREWREPIDLHMAVLQDAVPLQAILGSVTRRPYAAGAPIAWDGIITPGGPGFIGAVLLPGMRAVTVEVDRATTSANIIYPGDRVDVIMVTAGDGPQVAAQAIVRDVRVLAVGSTIFSLGRYGRVSLSKAGAIEQVAPPAGENYTLEVLPVDAERISLAANTGRLTLAMRSVSAPPDYDDETPRPVRLSEVLVEPKTPAPPPQAPPVRIIRGSIGQEAVAVDS